ncbi:Transglutaminase-like enzyme, putative cysteine protease [Flavobacterium glycines]|jgi:transglutaminase-like putative cysteine protease|uniref:Transglutaminase n=1 Tax=Flavobacterium glycines TaxID=551990 RepID=A0A1B9DNR9_9FLAO|nr:transglutaminase family protein [Flavobacterium glycines]OCB71329.1 transglutaminase [Flavobacterium glycines]GEL10343.1 transglutaminase [Flavobacterium glycines]SDI71699.1 Transglutaminase-like enzyme, putative cysteine protease [Flavobacterium glycines]
MAVFNIIHITKYKYNLPIKESINEIRLFPHNFENQDVLQYQLSITQNPNVSYTNDYHGNRVGNFNTLEAHNEMTIESRMLVRVNHSLKIPEIDETKAKDLNLHNDIYLLRLCSPESIEKQEEINSILKEIDYENKSIIALAFDCSQYIYNNFTYTKGITNIETTVDEILGHRKGVCQDFAHVLLQLLRTAGIPSRYVSGYICPNESGLRGEGATHAWVEIYTPKQGWLGIDPTNNIWTMDNHVKLSVGMNFNDCTPVKGTFKGISKQTLSVFVSIGYEDGRHFEEINDVELQKNSVEFELQLNHAEQQQQ